jgi:hypothetical protein
MTGYLLLIGFLAILGVAITFVVSLFSERCEHQWTLIKNAELVKYDKFGKEVPYGLFRVHECEKCKKLKKEQVEM